MHVTVEFPPNVATFIWFQYTKLAETSFIVATHDELFVVTPVLYPHHLASLGSSEREVVFFSMLM